MHIAVNGNRCLRKGQAEVTAKADPTKVTGINGFLYCGNQFFSVISGKILLEDDTEVGEIWEDGLVRGKREPFGPWNDLKSIEELGGPIFKGSDDRGAPLELPGPERGPIGELKYNNQIFLVLFGRIATPDHRLVGRMKDDGTLLFRDPRFPDTMRQMDEFSQLSTFFQGTKSNGEPLIKQFQRPNHKPDKTYWENEVMRYFEDIDRINGPQKKYVFETMRLFAATGLLQVVRKNTGTAGLGNVKHGASGVTAVYSGNVNLDREEFEREVNFFKKFGALMAVPSNPKPYIEVRLNMVVPHEYGHQLEFSLSQAAAQHVREMYERREKKKIQPESDPKLRRGLPELIQPQQLEERVFISGYAGTTWNEYFAESVGAFAVKEGRETLKHQDPEMYQFLMKVVFEPEKMLSKTLEKYALDLQTSLRVGGELQDNLLNQC